MNAVGLDFEKRKLTGRRIREPQLAADDEVLFRVQEVGICGTDRELAAFNIVAPPEGESFMTIGHEALGEIIEVGDKVKGLQTGDWVVPVVRRPCAPPCAACAGGRADFCVSGRYRERGIIRMHGYFTEMAVDCEEDLILVPPEILGAAVLLEPLSVVEKAVDLAIHAHPEIWAGDRPRALVLGAGPVGILSALALSVRGFVVAVRSLEGPDSDRARLLEQAGVRYLDSNEPWAADIAIEAAGAAGAALSGLRSLAPMGVLVVLGATTALMTFPFRDMIIHNQVLIGSVNASAQSFLEALNDLRRFDRKILARLIERRPFCDYEKTILGPPGDGIKIVHVMR